MGEEEATTPRQLIVTFAADIGNPYKLPMRTGADVRTDYSRSMIIIVVPGPTEVLKIIPDHIIRSQSGSKDIRPNW